MKIIFAGTPEFALPALQALLDSRHQVIAVYTKPDRPAGRGQKLMQTAVKSFAQQKALPIYEPISLKNPIVQAELANLGAELIVNVAYGLILPEAVLTACRLGCINIHPSLLPRWRGAAPIQRAIMAGDQMTGVTIMQMDAGVDTGAIYLQQTLPITPDDTTGTILVKTAALGADLLLTVIEQLATQQAQARQQDDRQATYAKKILKEEGVLDWHNSAQQLNNLIRAFNPSPVAYSQLLNGPIIRIWQATTDKLTPFAQQYNNSRLMLQAAGTIIGSSSAGLDVLTGDGVLRLLKIQFPGKKPLLISELLNAYADLLQVGRAFTMLPTL